MHNNNGRFYLFNLCLGSRTGYQDSSASPLVGSGDSQKAATDKQENELGESWADNQGVIKQGTVWAPRASTCSGNSGIQPKTNVSFSPSKA